MININRVKYLIAGAALLLTGTISAQQDPMYTQYMFNLLAVNPAYAGSHGALNVTGLYRNQWVGVEGAPSTQTLFAHSPFIKKNIGLGLTVVNDKIGPVRQTMLFADYSYTIRVSANTKLAMGLKAGINMLKTSFSDVELTQTNDQSFVDEPLSPQPNFGFGLYLYSEKYYVGVSVPKLLKNKLEQTIDYSKITLQQHFFIMGGYVFTINDKLKFKPTSLIKMTGGAPMSLDLTASILYREKLWLGIGHRFGDSFGALIQFQVSPQLRLGYSFDQTLSQMARYNSGSHEIMFTYDFIFKKDKIISPRYF
ncbi:MAG TPA: type IX secretion system membrane protein PorP/SprF [Bacteroidales bacterium]|nr:type IX secretion system membrane protein PorP/SprF [Bacteroidales bacterium]